MPNPWGLVLYLFWGSLFHYYILIKRPFNRRDIAESQNIRWSITHLDAQ
jgi:hypothetical protein